MKTKYCRPRPEQSANDNGTASTGWRLFLTYVAGVRTMPAPDWRFTRNPLKGSRPVTSEAPGRQGQVPARRPTGSAPFLSGLRTFLYHRRVQKLHCYVDETGQDAASDVFVVVAAVSDREQEPLREALIEIESIAGIGRGNGINRYPRGVSATSV